MCNVFKFSLKIMLSWTFPFCLSVLKFDRLNMFNSVLNCREDPSLLSIICQIFDERVCPKGVEAVSLLPQPYRYNPQGGSFNRV